MIFNHQTGFMRCDHFEAVKKPRLADEEAEPPKEQCRRGIKVRLMLTVQGTWIPEPHEGWQLMRFPGSPHSLFGCYCPDHHIDVQRAPEPSKLVAPPAGLVVTR